MYFPGGSKYQTFVRSPKGLLDFQVLANFGAKRFWYDTDEQREYLDKNLLKTKHPYEEIVDARGLTAGNEISCQTDTVEIHKGNGDIEVAGVISLMSIKEAELYHICQTYSTVFIHNDFHHYAYAKFWNRRPAHSIRWILNAQEMFPDVRMIASGTFNWDLAYCYGLDGCLNKVSAHTAYPTYYRPDGTVFDKQVMNITNKDILGEFDYLLEKYPLQRRYFYALLMVIMSPEYIKRFYENFEPGGFEPGDFAKHEYYFGYIFMNSRLTKEKVYTEADVWDYKRASGKYDKGRVVGLLPKKFISGDGMLCATCSLNYCCKLYLPGGACRVPGTEGSEFVEKFKSTDAQEILSGMGDLLAMRAGGVKTNMEKCINSGTAPDKELNKEMGDLFKDAATLAKLRDPRLTSPKLALQINNNGPALPPGSPGASQGQLGGYSDLDYSNAIREIEAAGIPRASISPEQVERYLEIRSDEFARQKQLEEMVNDSRPQVAAPPDLSNIQDAEIVEDGAPVYSTSAESTFTDLDF